ncbi:MAG: hypothetical protein ACYC3B_02630 [Sedimentisphaerales bacterium]
MKDIKNYLYRIKLVIEGRYEKIPSIKVILTGLNQYGNLIVAIATVVLAYITWAYIYEAKQMRLETKRLADISVEQFKIRAYPSFIVSPEIKLESDRLVQTFKISQRGEISAHKLTVLPIDLFSDGTNVLYEYQTGTIYKEGNSENTSLDFEITLLHNAMHTLESKKEFPKSHTINTLKYLLIILKFWVPYDDKYSYQISGYMLKKSDPDYIWQRISMEDTRTLMSNPSWKVTGFDDKRVKNFFKDFNPATITE